MARTLTDPNDDNVIEWTEKAMDADGDNLSVDLELDAIDDGSGFTQEDTDASNLPWLSFSTRTNLQQDGTREVFVDIEADATQLSIGHTYRFEVTADDGISGPVSRMFELDIIEEVAFNGTKMYVVGYNSTALREHDLSTAWDVSTASQNQTLDISSEVSNPVGVFVNWDGTKMYVLDGVNDLIHEYDLSAAWDVSTASFNQSRYDSGFAGVEEVYFHPDGTKMYVGGRGTSHVHEFDLSTAWDISTASETQLIDLSSQLNNTADIYFRWDGAKLYVSCDGTSEVYEYDLSTPWDMSSAVFNQSFDVSDQETEPNNLFFKSDGTKMYVGGGVSESIHEYDLSTAWDISAASFNQSQGLLNDLLSVTFGGP